MRRASLNPKILQKLKRKLPLGEQVIRNKLSKIGRDHPYLTLNARAEILAKKKGFSVYQHLKDEDKKSLSTIKIEKIKIKVPSKTKKKEERITEIAKYPTKDKFLKAHLDEINRAYTYKCYTSAFILCRKVLENLIINILRKKYPKNIEEHREKYFDFNKGRFIEFENLLRNLRRYSKDFGTEKKLVERICDKAEEFKDIANDMTHSLFHIVTNKKEIDDKEFQTILDLIETLEKS